MSISSSERHIFDDVIWSDECTVQMETHRRFCCRKKGEPPKPKPRYQCNIQCTGYIFRTCVYRPKHPLKVHVWAGISIEGRTAICIFEGIITRNSVNILDLTLLPSIGQLYPNGHRFMQDNDPKHTYGQQWSELVETVPDINPIENLWHELKEYIRREVKPKVKQELVDGIRAFWETVHRDKCRKYIRHLHKVLPKVIQVNGCATGY